MGTASEGVQRAIGKPSGVLPHIAIIIICP